MLLNIFYIMPPQIFMRVFPARRHVDPKDQGVPYAQEVKPKKSPIIPCSGMVF